jgi:hypothetical protein
MLRFRSAQSLTNLILNSLSKIVRIGKLIVCFYRSDLIGWEALLRALVIGHLVV